jgi:hypothetical protein
MIGGYHKAHKPIRLWPNEILVHGLSLDRPR